jgi:ribosome maturation factor RimP
LDRIEVSMNRKQAFVRVFVDKEGGVTLEDCQRVSKEIGTVLDVEDPMPGPYTLEVSSPGLDRPLRTEGDYERYRGRLVRVNTYAPVGGSRDFVGELLGLVEGLVQVRNRESGAVTDIPLGSIAKARLEIEL